MAETANPRTILHLVPSNDLGTEALAHPDNRRYVSLTNTKQKGLEIGFHVSLLPGRVIARLGRNTDLILGRPNVSAVHVAFEVQEDTLVILLSVRAKRSSTVVVKKDKGEAAESFEGDCVLVYGEYYLIRIAGYEFEVFWNHGGPTTIRDMVRQEYQRALEQHAAARSRYLPTEGDSEIHTWHHTRIQTARSMAVREATGVPRVTLAEGSFGTVYKALDEKSGHHFAIKVLNLGAFSDPERARSVAHREVKMLLRLKHV